MPAQIIEPNAPTLAGIATALTITLSVAAGTIAVLPPNVAVGIDFVPVDFVGKRKHIENRGSSRPTPAGRTIRTLAQAVASLKVAAGPLHELHH